MELLRERGVEFDAIEYLKTPLLQNALETLLEHPGQMQRPVVLRGARAVIARPPEKLLELLP